MLEIFFYNQKFTIYLITRYEQDGRGRKTIKAQQLWYAIIEAQTETGTPYMLYKDHCNRKSNQQNLGTIKCSNLCTEIVEYSSKDEVRVQLNTKDYETIFHKIMINIVQVGIVFEYPF